MDFNEKIGFICRSEYEWIECQKILFNKGFSWTRNSKKNYEINNRIYKPNTPPLILLINCSYNDQNNKQLEWNYYPMLEATAPEKWMAASYVEMNVLLRKYKLEKLNEL